MPRDTAKRHVFQLADTLVLDMYGATRALPRQEPFEIGRQLRRAALSVPANLIEGGQRENTREHRRFVGIALGSAAETRYLLTVAHRLGVMPGAAALIPAYEALLRGLHELLTSIDRLPDTHRSAAGHRPVGCRP